MSNQKTDTSVFSLFSPTAHDSDESPSGIAQIAPKLNAQTLFAFGVSTPFSIFDTIRTSIEYSYPNLFTNTKKQFFDIFPLFFRPTHSQLPSLTTRPVEPSRTNHVMGKPSKTHGP